MIDLTFMPPGLRAYVSSSFHAGDIFAEGRGPHKIPHLGDTPVRQRMWNPV